MSPANTFLLFRLFLSPLKKSSIHGQVCIWYPFFYFKSTLYREQCLDGMKSRKWVNTSTKIRFFSSVLYSKVHSIISILIQKTSCKESNWNSKWTKKWMFYCLNFFLKLNMTVRKRIELITESSEPIHSFEIMHSFKR